MSAGACASVMATISRVIAHTMVKASSGNGGNKPPPWFVILLFFCSLFDLGSDVGFSGGRLYWTNAPNLDMYELLVRGYPAMLECV